MGRSREARRTGSTSVGGAQTVARAFGILQCFKTMRGSISAAELARELDLNISGVHRLVRTMQEAGFLEQDENTRRYRLGTAIAGLNRALFQQRRFDLAGPELRWLSQQARGSAALAIRDGDEALVVGEVPPAADGEHVQSFASIPVPLHVSAFGKTLLAWSYPAEAQLEALAPLERYTEHSITSVAALRDELAVTRERGYAVAAREMAPHRLTVAVPILDTADAAYLAVGVGVDWNASNARRVKTLARLAQESAQRLRPLLVPGLAAHPLRHRRS